MDDSFPFDKYFLLPDYVESTRISTYEVEVDIKYPVAYNLVAFTLLNQRFTFEMPSDCEDVIEIACIDNNDEEIDKRELTYEDYKDWGRLDWKLFVLDQPVFTTSITLKIRFSSMDHRDTIYFEDSFIRLYTDRPESYHQILTRGSVYMSSLFDFIIRVVSSLIDSYIWPTFFFVIFLVWLNHDKIVAFLLGIVNEGNINYLHILSTSTFGTID